ncbi:tyrosine-type recombinase/integrase [Bacteroides zoogleoformans]|uniref:tyrosine-type recombinase/integrase n=1 Tax=Bacteroides zoogleoformans TaxID=28119 RepID=UPI00248ED645|nr:site-specific integrase [Bacteroides zoogleoformans]
MFNIPFHFKRAFSFGEKKTEKRVRKPQKISPTLSGFVHAAAEGVSLSTQENYRTAVRSFIRFSGGTDVPVSALDADSVRNYERWLRDRGVCPNTSSCYMRSLRAIYNKTATKRLVKDKEPFRGVFTGNERTVKRSIGEKEIRKLKSLRSPYGLSPGPSPIGRGEGEWGSGASDFFLFSFYAMGMPFVDLAHLKRSQIKDGVLTYRRRKTGQQVRVRLEPCMLDILDKYKTEGTDYLFPILYKVKDGAKDRMGSETDKGKDGGKGGPAGGNLVEVSYSSALNRYNRSLKELARRAGIKENLTSYVARHSWASIAYEKNIDLPVISKALGHTDTKTTLIYITEIKDKRLASANRKLLKEVFTS